MKLKEILQQEKEMMTPLRRKVNKWIFISYFSLMALLAVVIPLMIIDETKYLFVLFICLGLCVAYVGGLLFLNPRIIRKETELELETFSYLFSDVKPLEQETITIVEEDISYTLTKQGVKVEIPEKVLRESIYLSIVTAM